MYPYFSLKLGAPFFNQLGVYMRLLRLFAIITMLFTGKGAVADKKLDIGQPAPIVSGLDESGKNVNLGDVYKNNKYVLVYFYPKADTPGCTAQACSLRDSYADLQKRGVAIYGVSTDSVEDQKKFKEKFKLPFSLLSDSSKQIAKGFNVSVTLGFTSRQAFLIKNGTVVWLDRKASTKEQAQDVIKFLDSETK